AADLRKLQMLFIGSSPNPLRPLAMPDVNLNRRMATWLLTLPGPWEAASHLDVLAQARQSFDPPLDETHFQKAFSDAGYRPGARADSRFHLEHDSLPLPYEPALRRAA